MRMHVQTQCNYNLRTIYGLSRHNWWNVSYVLGDWKEFTGFTSSIEFIGGGKPMRWFNDGKAGFPTQGNVH